MHRVRLVLVVILLVPGTAGRGQDAEPAVLFGENREAADQLAIADVHLAAGRWEEAIVALQAVLDLPEPGLVEVVRGGGHLVRARDLANTRLAGLPPAGLERYRERAEGLARRRLEQGLATRDGRLLRQVVDEAFATRSAEKALDALGDLAFERGAFGEAESWWRLIAPPAGVQPQPKLDRVHPDATGGPARSRAKQLLSRLFAGVPDWEADLAVYQRVHPDAEGQFAGSRGRYVDLLKEAARRYWEGNRALAPSAAFGGDATRGRVEPASVAFVEKLGETCRVPALHISLQDGQRIEPRNPRRPRRSGAEGQSSAYHPLLIDRLALVADASRVTAYNLETGAVAIWHDAARDLEGGFNLDRKLPGENDLRFTMTRGEDCVYARLGVPTIRLGDGPPPDSLLVSLALKPDADGRRLRWQLRPGSDRDAGVFEGAPVTHDGLVQIAATRAVNGKAVTAIHCYADDLVSTPALTPPLSWRQDVVSAADPAVGRGRTCHQLLTLVGSEVVFCSHSGAVIALDALTGARRWAVRYPSRPAPQRNTPEVPHDLAPCLAAEGRLFVAPADADLLLCLDPATGRILWSQPRGGVLHLLGVGRGRLFFTTATGLCAVAANDGSASGGWTLPNVGTRLATGGRGQLVGDRILWPTSQGLLAIRQEDGRQEDDPTLLRNVPVGNLVYQNGILLVADKEHLTAFLPPRTRRN
jgi:hypothetical protein